MSSNGGTAHPASGEPPQTMRITGIGCFGGRHTLLRIVEKIAGSMPWESGETLRILRESLLTENTGIAGFHVAVETGVVRVSVYTRRFGAAAAPPRQGASPPAEIRDPAFS